MKKLKEEMLAAETLDDMAAVYDKMYPEKLKERFKRMLNELQRLRTNNDKNKRARKDSAG